MSEEKIIAGNRLIAEFMGGKIVGEYFSCNSWDIPDIPGYQHALFYHNSWDWLMPALKRYNEFYDINLLYTIKDSFNREKIFESLISQLKLRNKCQEEK